MLMRFWLFATLSILLWLSSCIPQKEYIYFSKSKSAPVKDTVFSNIQRKLVPEHVLAPGDIVNVVIATDVPIENSITSINAGNAAGTGSGVNILSDGYINVPLVGKIKASGMTMKIFQDTLLGRLKQFYKNPYVRTDFISFKVTVAGEVRAPGLKVITGDHATVFDALAMAGDLTENAKRQNVRVMRTEGNTIKEYFLDLASVEVFNSEGFFLQSNDIIYVTPYQYARYLSKTQQLVFLLNSLGILANLIVIIGR